MAFFDWNGNGKMDLQDDYLEYKIWNDDEDDSYESNNSWRDYCEDGSDYDLDSEDFDSEEEYEEALEEAKEKYAWRENCEDGFEYNIDPQDYETEEEYLKAIEQEFDETAPTADNSCSYDWRESFDKIENYGINPNDFENKEDFIHARATAAVVKSAESRANAARNSIVINEETLSDKTEYIYCGVMYEGNDFIYHYLADDESVKIGDTVIVPVGSTNEETTATVVSVGKYLRVAAPYPIEKTKKIIRKE